MHEKPLFDRVLLKPVCSEQNFSGLIIPDTSSNLKRAIVISAGAGKPGVPMSVTEGQTVLYKKDDTTEVTIEGEQYLIITERDIWMIK